MRHLKYIPMVLNEKHISHLKSNKLFVSHTQLKIKENFSF